MWTSTKQEGKSPRPPCLERMPSRTFAKGLRVRLSYLVSQPNKEPDQRHVPSRNFRELLASMQRKLKSSETCLRLNEPCQINHSNYKLAVLPCQFCQDTLVYIWKPPQPDKVKTEDKDLPLKSKLQCEFVWQACDRMRNDSLTQIEDLECKSPLWAEPSCSNPGFMFSSLWNDKIKETDKQRLLDALFAQ